MFKVLFSPRLTSHDLITTTSIVPLLFLFKLAPFSGRINSSVSGPQYYIMAIGDKMHKKLERHVFY